MRSIGCNHSAQGWYYGGIDSSFGGTFKDEEVLIETGVGDIVHCLMGDITDAYEMLKDEVEKLPSNDFRSVSNAILRVVCNYFGDYSNVSHRMDFYTPDDIVESDADIGRVADLKGKNAAMCVERSMLSQNLLQSLGFESYYKATGVINNGKSDVHAFNLVKDKDKYYLFDATIPAEYDGEMTPIITELPEDIYNTLKSPLSKDGYSVVVSHYNPLRDLDVEIIYDAGRENVLDTTNIKSK